MIRVAAVGDVHYDQNRRPELRAQFETLPERADIFLIAGDLTRAGTLEEARALASDLTGLGIPVVAILGNHDYHSNRNEEIKSLMRDAGVVMLEGETAEFKIREHTIGVMGMKGFGGGFFGACVSEFGELEMKHFAHHAKVQAEILKAGLNALCTEFKFALLHYSPIDGTLLGEKREIYPFLGSYLLAEAIDEAAANAVFHGHAHHGVEKGSTQGGVPVRNVALPVIRHAFNVYSFDAVG